MSTLLDKVVQRHNGHDIILTTFAGSFTLNELVRETDKYAKMLAQHNIKRKRIGILVPQLQSFLPIVMVFTALYAGARVIAPESFDMQRMLRLMQESKPNRIVTTPSIMKAIYTFAHKLAPEVIETLKAAALGGELMTTESIRELPLPVDCRMVGMYGSTEMGGMMFIEDIRKELVWTLYPDVVCEPGEGEDGVYECLIRAPGQFAGYYKAPALTSEAFTADNLFKTGDLIRIHDDRAIEIVGRKKEMIKKGGQ
jgi:acyl-coenzyme A synthetase/AMP-(fatty) acid ligase